MNKLIVRGLCGVILFLTLAVAKAQAFDPYFFADSTYVGDGVYYSPHFGYYNLDYYYGGQNYIYKYDFGYLYYLGDDGSDGDYFYDSTEQDYLYTSASLYSYNDYAYFYSYNLGTYLYYLEGSSPREFYDYSTGTYIFY